MKIVLENVGKIGTASVEINGITVIAGENNSGKSSVGKALFALNNSLYQSRQKISNDIRTSIERIMEYPAVRRHIPAGRVQEGVDHLVELRRELGEIGEEARTASVRAWFLSEAQLTGELAFEIENAIEHISEILAITDAEIISNIFTDLVGAEFNQQVTNLYLDRDAKIAVDYDGHEVVGIVKRDSKSFQPVEGEVFHHIDVSTEAIYLDCPFVLDELETRIAPSIGASIGHKQQLIQKLRQDKRQRSSVELIRRNKKLNRINEMLAHVIGDTQYFGVKEAPALDQSVEKRIHIRNLSTGLKSFVVLKELLVNGAIEEGSILILDEPEVHLHPEWQLIFAELVVLLYQQLRIKVLLNTHSLYLLRALEVYSSKYEVMDACKFYLSELVGPRGMAEITDVTEEPEQIYAKLATPLQKLEDERWKNA